MARGQTEGQGGFAPQHSPPRATALGTPDRGSRGPSPPWRGLQGGSAPLVTVLALPTIDWLARRLIVSGPAAAVRDFQ